MRRSAVGAGLAGMAGLLLLSTNARFPSDLLVSVAQVAVFAAFLSGGVSLFSGISMLYASRPDSRRGLVYLCLLTTFVLAAHVYIINSPATFTPERLTVVPGQQASGSHLNVVSTLAGNTMRVDVFDIGDSAVSSLKLTLDGVVLPNSALSVVPTAERPLEPTDAGGVGFPTTTHGNWTVSLTSNSSLLVDYDVNTCFHVPRIDDARAVYGCVMDEVFYVPSAQGFLSGEQCAQYGDSCNQEHPPLAKGLIAAGMAVFGVNDVGWRISNVVMGTLSVPLIAALVLTLGGSRRLAYASSTLFAADVMFFIHSSIAVIDVPAVFFSLLGAIFYFRPRRVWKLDGFIASGVFFGLAVLSKETAGFSVAAVLAYDLVFGPGTVKALFSRMGRMVVPSVLVFVGGLQLYDSLFTAATQPWFYQQISFMLSYGSSLIAHSLQCQPVTGYWCKFADSPGGAAILPFDWVLFYAPVVYLVVDVSTAAGTYISSGYLGTTNPLVVWLLFAWVPVVFYRLFQWRKTKLPIGGEDRAAAFVLTWFILNYVPYLLLFFYGRVTYPFYIIPAIPALAIGSGYFLTRNWFPWKLAVFYLGAAFVFLFLYYPVKDFLPIDVRVLLKSIGH